MANANPTEEKILRTLLQEYIDKNFEGFGDEDRRGDHFLGFSNYLMERGVGKSVTVSQAVGIFEQMYRRPMLI